MAGQVLFTEAALSDIDDLFDWIADRAGLDAAGRYLDRIERYCLDLLPFPRRGTARDDIRPGLRVVGFQRRVSIAFMVRDSDVIILRILYAGRSLESAFED